MLHVFPHIHAIRVEECVVGNQSCSLKDVTCLNEEGQETVKKSEVCAVSKSFSSAMACSKYI